ncbi:DUF862-domain-containing protein [Clavulina sp. PMI_390]|nr:DUF862-domain-containing protein [Clavulina sp. PMI_390]
MAPVKLYIYDLSGGMARLMSRQLTGIQIDGVWHTSIVVFGKEVYYGQGVNVCAPGGSHLGLPLEVHDLGETEIDDGTFWEYIEEMKSHYTAEKYHLLEFNCNSFTNDVAGFLTGGSIPSHIKDLPATVMSTPFGQSIRPMIDQMYSRPGRSTPGAYPTPAATPPSTSARPTGISPDLASTLLQSVASQAAGSSRSSPTSAASLTSPLHISTNVASLEHIISTHRATAVLVSAGANKPFEQALEQVARENVKFVGAAFVKVDTTVGQGKEIASKYSVPSLPGMILFHSDTVVNNFAITDASSLRGTLTQFLAVRFSPHPHISKPLPSISSMSTDPILYTQLPSAIDVPITKLASFIDGAALKIPMSDSSSGPALEKAKATLKASFGVYLKRRFPANSTPEQITGSSSIEITSGEVKKWKEMSETLLGDGGLALSEVFPLVDLWRVAVLDPSVSSKLAPSIVPIIQGRVSRAIASKEEVPRPTFLTALRLLANTFAHPSATSLEAQAQMKDVVVAGLLHTDTIVRTAAASLAFNFAARRQAPFRAEVARRSQDGGEGELDIELVVALLEAVEKEESEEVVHRLAGSLALLIYLSPSLLPSSEGESDSELSSMLSVLDAKEKLEGKLVPGGCGPKGVVKPDVRKLIGEVASLCS